MPNGYNNHIVNPYSLTAGDAICGQVQLHASNLGIAHSKAGWKIRPPSRKIEVSKYNEKGVLEWMK